VQLITTTDQSIGGLKSFISPVNFFQLRPNQFECMRIDGLYLYWTIDQTNLDNEGNLRIWTKYSLDCLTLQEFRNNLE
jgi:hypothetical protein